MRGSAALFCKEPEVYVVGFVGQTVSVTTTQSSIAAPKPPETVCKCKRCARIPIKLHVTDTGTGWIWPVSCICQSGVIHLLFLEKCIRMGTRPSSQDECAGRGDCRGLCMRAGPKELGMPCQANGFGSVKS